jgi:hypothetical protein
MFLNQNKIEKVLHQIVINEVRKREQLSRTGDVVLLGDPLLKGRDLIYLAGVATVHAGKHYVKKCKHTINSSGYTTKCSTYQESPAVQQLLRVLRRDPSKAKTEMVVFDIWQQRKLDEAKYLIDQKKRDDVIEERFQKERKDLISGMKKQFDATQKLRNSSTGETIEEFNESRIKVYRPDEEVGSRTISNPEGQVIQYDLSSGLRYTFEKQSEFDLSTFLSK